MSAVSHILVATAALGVGLVASQTEIGDSIFNNKESVTIQSTAPNIEPTTPTSISPNVTTTVLGFTISTEHFQCGTTVKKVVVDERARIGETLSLLKAIDINIPGATSRNLPSELVPEYVIAFGEFNNMPNLEQPQIDNFKPGTYDQPSSCIQKDTGVVFIP